MAPLTVGVLALQGAFAKHAAMLQALNANPVQVRKPEDLDQCAGLIIPGGESTTMIRQMRFIHFEGKLKEFAKDKPLFGTCAGLILMSKEVIGDPIQPLDFLDIAVERNAFGRQAESFAAPVEIHFEPKKKLPFHAVFIRAPRIRSWGEKVEVLASIDQEPILVRQGFHLGSVFHPELTGNPAIHEYFLNLIRQHKN